MKRGHSLYDNLSIYRIKNSNVHNVKCIVYEASIYSNNNPLSDTTYEKCDVGGKKSYTHFLHRNRIFVHS
jgi:hypothetical protein